PGPGGDERFAMTTGPDLLVHDGEVARQGPPAGHQRPQRPVKRLPEDERPVQDRPGRTGAGSAPAEEAAARGLAEEAPVESEGDEIAVGRELVVSHAGPHAMPGGEASPHRVDEVEG